MQQTDSIFALPATYPAITPFTQKVPYPLLIAAIHEKSYKPQLPPLTNSSWNDVYARNANKRSYPSALENLGDAILRWILAQLARKTIPTLQHLSSIINSNVVYGNIAQRLRLHKNVRGGTDFRLATPGNVDLRPVKQYANLFETMVGAYWMQPGATYEEVFNWIDVTFRPLFTSIINKVKPALAPEPPATFRPIRRKRPGVVTRSNAVPLPPPPPPPQPQPQSVESMVVATKRPSPPPAKRPRYERTGPVLNLPYEVVDLTMLDCD